MGPFMLTYYSADDSNLRMAKCSRILPQKKAHDEEAALQVMYKGRVIAIFVFEAILTRIQLKLKYACIS